jgi:hypothetical protein
MLAPSIIDIESSGFGYNSYPIEIAIAHSSGERFCTLIQPASNWTYWDCDAEKVHHISREQLYEAGLPIREVAMMLNKQFAGQTLYSDGWVVDKPWIAELFYAAGIPMQFSVSPIELIMDEAQMDCWDDIKKQVLNEKGLVRHRASNDAYIIQETFRRTAWLVKKLARKAINR